MLGFVEILGPSNNGHSNADELLKLATNAGIEANNHLLDLIFLIIQAMVGLFHSLTNGRFNFQISRQDLFILSIPFPKGKVATTDRHLPRSQNTCSPIGAFYKLTQNGHC